MATVDVLAQAAKAVYQDKGALADWRIFAESPPNDEGLYAIAYKNDVTNEIIVSYRGTTLTDLGDLAADGAILLGNKPEQFDLGKAFFDEVRSDPENVGSSFQITGHSLGGAISQYVAVEYARVNIAIPTVTFESPPLGSYAQGVEVPSVLNLRIDSDPIAQYVGTRTLYNVGQTIDLADPRTMAERLINAASNAFQLGGMLRAGYFDLVGNPHSMDTTVRALNAAPALRDLQVAGAVIGAGGQSAPPSPLVSESISSQLGAPPVGPADPLRAPSSSFIDIGADHTASLKAGGTLSDIVALENANGNPITVEDLRRANGLTPEMDTKLRVGQQLLVPERNGDQLTAVLGGSRLVIDTARNTTEINFGDGSGSAYDSAGQQTATIAYSDAGRLYTYLNANGAPTGTKEFVNPDNSREVTYADLTGAAYNAAGQQTATIAYNRTTTDGSTGTVYTQINPATGSPTGATTTVFGDGVRQVMNGDGTGAIYGSSGGKASEVEVVNGVETRYLVGAYGQRTGEFAKVWTDGTITGQISDSQGGSYGYTRFEGGELRSYGDGRMEFIGPQGQKTEIGANTDLAMVPGFNESFGGGAGAVPDAPKVEVLPQVDGKLTVLIGPGDGSGTLLSGSDKVGEVEVHDGYREVIPTDGGPGSMVFDDGYVVNTGGGDSITVSAVNGAQVTVGGAVDSIVTIDGGSGNSASAAVAALARSELTSSHDTEVPPPDNPYSQLADSGDGDFANSSDSGSSNVTSEISSFGDSALLFETSVETVTRQSSPRTSGCFTAETPVLMADGAEKAIAAIMAGERVMAFDGLGGLTSRRVVRTFIHQDNEVMEVAGVRATAAHRFLTEDGEWVSALRLQVGQAIATADGRAAPYAGPKPVAGRYTVHNIEVEELHTGGEFSVRDTVKNGGRDTLRNVSTLRFDDRDVQASVFNTAPIAEAKRLTTVEDTTLAVTAAQLLAGATDINGDATSLLRVGAAHHGKATLEADGDVTFTPDKDYNGAAGFSYTIGDSHGGEVTQDVVVSVTEVNDAPLTPNKFLLTAPNRPLVLTGQQLLAGCWDADGDTMSLLSVGNASHGIVGLGVDGQVTFLPDPNYLGPAEFNCTVSDGKGGTSVRQISIKVGLEVDVNTRPILSGAKDLVGAVLADGRQVFAWTSGNTDAETDVFIQLVNDGLAVAPPIRANSTKIGPQSCPTVTMLTDGGFLVAWQSASRSVNYLTDYGIYAQRYDTTGQPIGSEFRVNATAHRPQDKPSTASLPDGGFVVCWVSGFNKIVAQRFRVDGSRNGSEMEVSSSLLGKRTTPNVAVLANGDMVFAWEEDRNTVSSDLIARVFAFDGQARGSAFYAATTSDFSLNTAITALADGHYVIVWQTFGQDGSFSGISGQIYNGAGEKIGGEFQANTTTFLSQALPSVAAPPDGGFFVAWVDSYNGGAGQKFAADGAKQGHEIKIGASGAENVASGTRPTLLVGLDGIPTAAWVTNIYGMDFGITVRSAESGHYNSPVVWTPLAVSLDEDAEAFTTNLLSGAAAPDTSSTLSATNVVQTSGRTVQFAVDGNNLRLGPGQFNDLAVGKSETVTFGFKVANVNQTLMLTVEGRNDGPVAQAKSISTNGGASATIQAGELLAGASDIDGDAVHLSGVGHAVGGSAVLNGDGAVTFTPSADAGRTASFDYTVSDGHGGTDTKTVAVFVNRPCFTAFSRPSANMRYPVGRERLRSARNLVNRSRRIDILGLAKIR
ncbi:MAG: cadherin-like domain-containing protein [Phaeospirillum sp.]|nr:cadherin-like domain-containing protein [Phaeospirillum sp.]